MRQRAILVMAGLLFAAGGCGYTTRAYVAQTGYKTIYVAPFVNKVNTTSEFSEGHRFKTYFPLLENTVTDAVANRYVFDGSLKIAKEDQADLVLTGELVDYRRDSLRNDAVTDTPQQYRINIFVNIKLVDNRTKKVVWERKNFAGDAEFFTTGAFIKPESQAIQDAVDDLARRIVELTVESW